MDHVVLDAEIAHLIDGPEGYTWADTDRLGIACVCLWESKSGRLRVYGPDDLPDLKDRLLRADRVTTFNGFVFDLPLIWRLRQPNRVGSLCRTSDDLYRRIKLALGLNPDGPCREKGWGLDAIGRATLGVGKIGHGAEAPADWQAGKFHKVVTYCADDVLLTRDLSDFIDRYGYVLNERGRLHVPRWEPGPLDGANCAPPAQSESSLGAQLDLWSKAEETGRKILRQQGLPPAASCDQAPAPTFKGRTPDAAPKRPSLPEVD